MSGRRGHLARRLALVGLLCLGPAVVVGSACVLVDHVWRVLLNGERESTTDSVREAVTRSLPESVLREPETAETGRLIASAGRMLLDLPAAVRVKVFDGEGTVIWSDEPRLVGANFRSDARVGRSLGGTPSVAIEPIEATPEHAFEVGRFRELTSVYVPILAPETGKVALVFEVYKLPDALRARLGESRFVVWTVALAAGAVLLVSQISLVRGAERTITRQGAALSRRVAQLAALRDELGATQRKLVGAERLTALGEATVAVAHGLRNPLAGIRALAQEAGEGLDAGDPIGGSLEDITRQVDRLEERLRAVVASARPADVGRRAPEALAPLVARAAASIGRRVAETGARVELDVPPEVPPILADRPRLEQAVQEILVNSLDAGARRVRVSARADTTTGWIELRVEDDGRGITPEAAARAFELFFTTKPDGSGVGLTAARRIAREHGGVVSIAPRSEGGAVVAVRLPAAPSMGGRA